MNKAAVDYWFHPDNNITRERIGGFVLAVYTVCKKRSQATATL